MMQRLAERVLPVRIVPSARSHCVRSTLATQPLFDFADLHMFAEPGALPYIPNGEAQPRFPFPWTLQRAFPTAAATAAAAVDDGRSGGTAAATTAAAADDSHLRRQPQ